MRVQLFGIYYTNSPDYEKGLLDLVFSWMCSIYLYNIPTELTVERETIVREVRNIFQMRSISQYPYWVVLTSFFISLYCPTKYIAVMVIYQGVLMSIQDMIEYDKN